MHYLNNLIVEPLCNYGNAICGHERPYCCHDNNDEYIKYGSKAHLLNLQHNQARLVVSTEVVTIRDYTISVFDQATQAISTWSSLRGYG